MEGIMTDKSKVIYGNVISDAAYNKALKSKKKFIKKYGDDTDKVYHLGISEIPQIKEIKIRNLVLSDSKLELPENPLVVGNIRMGFGH